jgi:hypothetical protein
MTKNNSIKCPVCQKRLLRRAIKNHIINSAEAEGFTHLNNLLDAAKNKPYSFSPIVLLRQSGHLKYYRRNLKMSKKRTFHFCS